MEILKLPRYEDLVTQDETSLKQNALTVLLNQNPPNAWLVEHPMIKGYKYIPIEKIEYLLTRLFPRWWVEIRSSQVMANSVVVTVRLYVINPITGETEYNDGIGAAPIQTNKGAGATDWEQVKTDSLQKAAPAAETYAIKDAAEKFGKIFGRDVSRKGSMDYNGLLKQDQRPKSDFNLDNV